VPAVLRDIGISHPPELTGNMFAVLSGVVQTQLPFVVLPIYAALVSVRPEYLRAATSLGANGLRSFLRVTLPLTRQGVVVGVLLAFVYALGAYVIPAILGGRGMTLAGPAIQRTLQLGLGFGEAATMGVLLLVVATVLVSAGIKIAGIGTVVGQ
jgi:putative spermidine/putrescine transport system permease protein/spermidine/putrescine transport system permease protein